jgi:hypothetical protein
MHSLSSRRYQFTIRRLSVFIAECAAPCVFLALSPAGFFTMAFVWVVTCFLRKCGVSGAGILGGTITIFFVLVGFGIAGGIDVYFFGPGEPGAFDFLGPLNASLAEFACGLAFGAMVCAVLYVNFELPTRYIAQVCPTDVTGGSIVWRALDDTPNSVSNLR